MMAARRGPRVVVEEHMLGDRQRKAMALAAEELCGFMHDGKKKTRGKTFLNAIWPLLKRFTWRLKPVLKLMPLDRVGGEPGKSGVTVVSGRFFATDTSITPSLQMIIKISPDPEKDAALARDKREELLQEWAAARYLFRRFKEPENFAWPFWISGTNKTEPAVLWSLFTSEDPDYSRKSSEQDWDPREVTEMVKYLSARWSSTKLQENLKTRTDKLRGMIDAVALLRKAHSADGSDCRERVNLVKHYDWELRGFLNKNTKWAEKWHDLWRTKSRLVPDYGKKWANPVTVCKGLAKIGKLPLRMGYVHGDLHPRNIVFQQNDKVCVIDFGWARPRRKEERLQHIIKDFVLLEANLRFMTLPPFLPYKSATAFIDWIGLNRPSPRTVHDECKLRIDLIQDLRKVAKAHLGRWQEQDWELEYIAPLFLVSLGLLKHCHSADCTWAARYTVLALATSLEGYLKRNGLWRVEE